MCQSLSVLIKKWQYRRYTWRPTYFCGHLKLSLLIRVKKLQREIKHILCPYDCILNILLHIQKTGKVLCCRRWHLDVIFNISNIFNGANARNCCSISDCDTLWKVVGAGIICKYFCNTVQKCFIDHATV